MCHKHITIFSGGTCAEKYALISFCLSSLNRELSHVWQHILNRIYTHASPSGWTPGDCHTAPSWHLSHSTSLMASVLSHVCTRKHAQQNLLTSYPKLDHNKAQSQLSQEEWRLIVLTVNAGLFGRIISSSVTPNGHLWQILSWDILLKLMDLKPSYLQLQLSPSEGVFKLESRFCVWRVLRD